MAHWHVKATVTQESELDMVVESEIEDATKFIEWLSQDRSFHFSAIELHKEELPDPEVKINQVDKENGNVVRFPFEKTIQR